MATNLEPARLAFNPHGRWPDWWGGGRHPGASPPIMPPSYFQTMGAVAPQTFAPQWAGAPAFAPMQAAPQEIEVQMLGTFLREQTRDLIRKIYDQLDAHREQSDQYADCIALLTQTVQFFGAGEYGHAFTLAYEAWKSGVARGLSLQEPVPPAPAQP